MWPGSRTGMTVVRTIISHAAISAVENAPHASRPLSGADQRLNRRASTPPSGEVPMLRDSGFMAHDYTEAGVGIPFTV
jgi:hypothetical protein